MLSLHFGMIKSDKWIIEQVEKNQMIQPFEPKQIKENEAGEKCISYGLSSYGYDIRCTNEFAIFNILKGYTLIDPFQIKDSEIYKFTGDYCIIPANCCVLTSTVEKINMPRNVMAICLGKSTYARCGIIVNITPIEAGWTGYITIEISNTNNVPVKVYANQGIAQLLFFEGDQECLVSYKDRNGKYNDQSQSINHAKVE
jgi:dCTP deaminase